MARRYGEGSIYRRADGRWAAALVTGTCANGKPRRRTVYGHSRREVADKLARLQVDRLDGNLTEPSKLRLGEYLTRWLDSVSRPRTRPTTHAEYKRLVCHVQKHASRIVLSKLSPMHIEALQSELERTRVGARTRQAIHRVLRNALGDAVRLGLVRVNVAASIDTPRVPRKEIRVLDGEQTRHLLDVAVNDSKIGALVTLLSTTGLRIGEALALRWLDVDLRTGTIKVNRTLVEIDGKFSFQEPKSKASRRKVGIPQETVDALRALRSKIRGVPHPERLVFTDRRCGPLRRSNLIRRDWHPLLKLAELPKTGFHILRHSHATQLLAAGANPRAVADRLGHSQASLVLDVYGHVLPGADRELTDRTATLLRPGSA